MNTNCTSFSLRPCSYSAALTLERSYSVVGQMSGQYMKPKKRKDQRVCSEWRSNTRFASSTRINSASGRRSGKVTSAGAHPSSGGWILDCQSAQYPVPARVSPATAAASNVADIHLSRLNHLATTSAPLLSPESDNSVLPASIITKGFDYMSALPGLPCGNIHSEHQLGITR